MSVEANDSRTQDEIILAKLGYKQEFKRDFTTLELFGLGFNIMGVLPSVASVMFFSIPYGGPVAMVWGWAVCSVFLTFIALAIAELGSANPTSGGIYYWVFKLSPPKYRTFFCWLVGYVNTITYISAVAGFEWGCAVEIMAAISIGTDLEFQPTLKQTYGVFIALLICHAFICSLATKVLAKLQLVYIMLNVALCLWLFIAMPLHTPAEFMNDAKYAFGHFENISSWPSGYAFILSFLAPLWVVGGFDSTVHLSEEARNANVAIPWAIMSSTTITCILGWAINITLAFTMGQDIIDIISSPIAQPLATMILNSLGKKGALVLWCFIVVTQFTMVTSVLTSASRQMFAYSRDGALPLSKFLYKISPAQMIPVRAVWVTALGAALLGLTALGGAAASGAIFSMSVVGQYLCYSAVITARWTGGQEFVPGPFNLGRFSPVVSVVALLFMTLMTVVLLFPAEPQVTVTSMNYTVLVIGGVMILSATYYFISGVKWFSGPVETLELLSETDEKTSTEKAE
ncbi:amino acid/polyamine transporter I [Mycena floridula]|nr:amino acid/polyamine transporter I [Mycena floridula]